MLWRYPFCNSSCQSQSEPYHQIRSFSNLQILKSAIVNLKSLIRLFTPDFPLPTSSGCLNGKPCAPSMRSFVFHLAVQLLCLCGLNGCLVFHYTILQTFSLLKSAIVNLKSLIRLFTPDLRLRTSNFPPTVQSSFIPPSSNSQINSFSNYPSLRSAHPPAA